MCWTTTTVCGRVERSGNPGNSCCANDTTARIDLESAPAFDAFLALKDSDGTILAEDDDGGDGLHARIERALTAGTYEIVASSSTASETGAYQLKVDVPPPPTTTAAGTEGARAP